MCVNMCVFSAAQKSAILTTVGLLEQPLGNARLHVARLVASLLQTSDASLCQELCRLNIMDKLLVCTHTHTHVCIYADTLVYLHTYCVTLHVSVQSPLSLCNDGHG